MSYSSSALSMSGAVRLKKNIWELEGSALAKLTKGIAQKLKFCTNCKK